MGVDVMSRFRFGQDIGCMRFVFVIWAAFFLTTSHLGSAGAQPAKGKAKAKKPRAVSGKFGELLPDAIRLSEVSHLTSLYWYQDSKCAKYQNSFARTQCEGLQNARRNQVTKGRYYVRANGAQAKLLTMGPFDSKRSSAPLALSGCLFCPENGIAVVAGKRGPKTNAGKLNAGDLASRYFSFSGRAAAKHFREKVFNRLVVEFVSKIPPRSGWRAGKRKGYRAELIGYRVFDPCSGTVLLSSTDEQQIAADKDSCNGDSLPVFGGEAGEQKPKKLSNAAIADALRPVVDEARRCYSIYQVRGQSRLRLIVTGEGQIESFVHEGDFSGTPTGDCIDAVVRKVRFPATERPTTEVLYPIRIP